MGQSVTCSCGQLNNLDSYRYGEPRLCVACGHPLSPPPVELPARPQQAFKEEIFAPEPSPFEADSEEAGETVLTGFETPSADEALPEPEPAVRVWQGGIRETVAPLQENLSCAKCRRPFRGDWDKHPGPVGLVCHICATQADPTYKPPSMEARRALYRPEPPKKIAPRNPLDDSEEREKRRKTKRELIVLCTTAVIVLFLVNVLPVETWVAMFFASDLSQAEGLSPVWIGVLYVTNFVIGVIGHMAALFVALSLSKLLHPGGMEQNFGPLLFLGIAFEVLNTILATMALLFTFFGSLGTVLIGIAFVIMVTIKYFMVSSRFHIGFEGFFGFFLSWILASLLMKPGVFALLKFVQGIVAAIAL